MSAGRRKVKNMGLCGGKGNRGAKRGLGVKVTKAVVIQCAIVVLVLTAEIVYAGRYHAAYSMEQAEGTDLQEGAEKSSISEENTASALRGGAGSGISEEDAASGLRDEAGSGLPEENVASGLQDGTGSGEVGNSAESEKESPVYWIDDEAGIFLLAEARGDEKENFVYQDGEPGELLQVLNGKVRSCEDINFDGYPDIKICDSGKEENSYFLWDEKERQFVEAVSGADEVEKVHIERKFDDFGTFWGYRNIMDDDYRELQEMIEKLYGWDENVLKEIRSISCRLEEEEVVITLTDGESGKCLASETFDKRGWEANPEVRELYARFYQGCAPGELYYLLHDAPGEEQVIPEGLVKALKQAYENGTEGELFESLRAGRELTEREKKEAAEKSDDIAWYLEMVNVDMMLADLDNDGFDDIYVRADFGGSGGFGEYALCRGDGTGVYKRTDIGTEDYVRGEWFCVMCWEGKNYVCHRKGGRNGAGLIVEGYLEGELAETVSFNLVPGKQTDSVIFCEDGYRKMAERELEKAPRIYDRTKKHSMAVGDVEQKVESERNAWEYEEFLCDIDNDGTVEKYKKDYIDYPVDFLYFEMEDSKRELAVIPECRDEAGREIMMWVDACDVKNIMNVLYDTGLYEYMVEGFLVDETGGCSRLYAIERKTEPEVEVVRVWEVPERRDILF